jgi:hypothetical protein
MLPNDEIKKSLGCSPDKGLCYVYGQYGLQYVEPLGESRLNRDEDYALDSRRNTRIAL